MFVRSSLEEYKSERIAIQDDTGMFSERVTMGFTNYPQNLEAFTTFYKSSKEIPHINFHGTYHTIVFAQLTERDDNTQQWIYPPTSKGEILRDMDYEWLLSLCEQRPQDD